MFKKYQTFLYALIFLVFLLYAHSNHPLNSDEGIILDGAWNMLNGRKLYIDFFEIITPGSFFAIFLSWKIFGASYLVAKFISVFFVWLSVIGVYKICVLFSHKKWTYLAPFIFGSLSISWPIINHNSHSILFVIWAVYFLLRALEIKKRKYFVLLGVFTAFLILFLQSKGVIFLVGVFLYLIFLWFYKKIIPGKQIVYYILPAIAISIAVLSFWPLDIIYSDLVIVPTTRYIRINTVSLWMFFIFVLWFVFLWFVYRRNQDIKIKALLLIQALLLFSSLSRPDHYHLSLNIFPILVLTGYFLAGDGRKELKIFYATYSVVLIVLLLMPSVMTFIIRSPLSINKPISLVEKIKDNCEEIYAGPFLPGIYFETRKLNPGPYYSLFTDFNYPWHFAEQAEAVKKIRPDCAVLDYGMVSKFGYDKNNPLDNFIAEHYEESSMDRIWFYKD
ncbi:hypothetical protein C4566_00545 [Candidatus Parcubacteria bacterium]|nr:MAG: hypothetical protein C4566_00545 [Candidatus Parcubacteria bacterium]